YGTGSASGFFGEDTVRFGPRGSDQLVVPRTIIGQAVKIAPFFRENKCDGILGLAFRELAEGGVNPPLLNAFDQGLIYPIMTVYLEHDKQFKYGGVVTYGGVDKTHCGEMIAYERTTRDAKMWQFMNEWQLRLLQLKGVASEHVTFSKEWIAISDTSTSFLGLPSVVADSVADSAGAEYDEQSEMYMIECQAKPSLNLTIGDHVYTIEAVNLIAEIDVNFCIMTMFPISGHGLGSQMILGDPFIRQYCNIYDYNTKQIGFARSLQR
ncbi:unnamed protein product, partial [Heligmosomoides polygyrus]|uniref:Peptidase A1 domain-containing protein n=1 Tax=Heligmosomoides polygyrus TaxID=6339 RepID=A0A183G0A6_HELPZ